MKRPHFENKNHKINKLTDEIIFREKYFLDNHSSLK